MIFLGKKEFRDKVHACWLGKSIGGTMGAPYEGTHEYLSLAGFSSDAPNRSRTTIWICSSSGCRRLNFRA